MTELDARRPAGEARAPVVGHAPEPQVGPAEPLPGAVHAPSIRSEAAVLELPLGAFGGAEAVAAPGAQRPGTAAIAASALLPGAGHLVSGRFVPGLWLLFLWGVGLALLLYVRADLAATFRGGARLDHWIGATSLLAYLAGVWSKAMTDVAVRFARPPKTVGISQWTIAGRRFRKNRLAVAGLVIMGFIYLVTLMGPFLAPYDPNAQEDIVRTRYLSPSTEHPMGTDKFGRDVLSRVIYGARISLSIGFIAVAISVTLGTLVGSVSGYFGGWVDNLFMRLVDLLISFPRLVLLLAIIALFSPSIFLIIAVLGLTGWMGTSRIVRGQFLALREQEFVQATRALGFGHGRIILRHMLPNSMAPIIVVATLGIGNTILTEAALSFLGLGVQPPTASWGSMVSDGKDALINAWWISTFPGLAIVLTVVCFNLLGDAARDALDPRLRS
jgi:peptide/nickel transport system permease protein